jgi:hypothetical protein
VLGFVKTRLGGCAYLCLVAVWFWGQVLSAAVQCPNVANTPLVGEDGRPSLALKGLMTGLADCVKGMDFAQAFEDVAASQDPEEYNKLAQKYFLRRGERWEDQSESLGHKLAPSFTQILPLFQGFYALGDVYPLGQTFDAVLVHGAMTGRMIKRLDFLVELVTRKLNPVRAQNVYFLTGERDLDLGHEGEDIAHLKAKAEQKGIKVGHLQYEADVASLIVEVSDLPDDIKKRFHVVRAPKIKASDGSLQRPNTVSTLKAWKQDLSERPTSILAISNNPYILQQHAALRRQLMDWECTIQTVGASAYGTNASDKVVTSVPETALPLLLDTLARALYEDIQVSRSSQSK